MSKKVIKAAVIAAVVGAGILTVVACNKDNEKEDGYSQASDARSTKTGESSYGITMSDRNVSFKDIYYLHDNENSLWSWRRFENNDFCFDYDFIWDDICWNPTISVDTTMANLIAITYEDSTVIELNNVIQSNGTVTFNAVNDSGEYLCITIILPNGINFKQAVTSIANHQIITEVGPSGTRNLRGIIDVLKKLIKSYIQCKYELGVQVGLCAQNNCIPHQSDMCVICANDPLNNSTSNCSSYNYCCTIGDQNAPTQE